MSCVGRGLYLHGICKGDFRSQAASQTRTVSIDRYGTFLVGLEKNGVSNGIFPADLLKSTFLSYGHFELLEAFGPDFLCQIKRRKMTVKAQKNSSPTVFINRFLRVSRGPMLDVSLSYYLTSQIRHWEHTLVDTTLSSQLWSAVQNRIETDVEFLLRSGSTCAGHRCILSARSVVFHEMFKAQQESNSPIAIDDIDVNVFEELLHFIYTGQLRIPADNQQLLMAAVKFQVETLINVCQSAVQHCNLTQSEELNAILTFAFPNAITVCQ